MKILIIGNASSVFLYEYVLEVLNSNNNDISILALCSHTDIPEKWCDNYKKHNIMIYYPEQRHFKSIGKMVALYNLLRYRIVRKYDIIHLFGVPKLSFAAAKFSVKDTKLIVSYLGSDLLKSSPKILAAQRGLIDRATYITMATDYLLEKFVDTYGLKYSNKVRKIKYGTNNAKIIEKMIGTCDKKSCKQKFSLPEDKVCIFCGYNGNTNQQHLKIIEQIINVSEKYKEKFILVFHCSYGLEAKYEAELKKKMNDYSLPYIFLKNFLVGEELAELRICTDILLNLQASDAISASMVECLEARAIVVKGDWLKYPDLKDNYLLSINRFEDLPILIEKIIDNYVYYYNNTVINKGVLSRLLSWDNCKRQWRELIAESEISE